MNPDQPKLKMVTMPVFDTGLGREAGYESDEDLMDAARRERDALPPHVREAVDDIDEALTRQFLFGDES